MKVLIERAGVPVAFVAAFVSYPLIHALVYLAHRTPYVFLIESPGSLLLWFWNTFPLLPPLIAWSYQRGREASGRASMAPVTAAGIASCLIEWGVQADVWSSIVSVRPGASTAVITLLFLPPFAMVASLVAYMVVRIALWFRTKNPEGQA